jgi:hypothetical protein
MEDHNDDKIVGIRDFLSTVKVGETADGEGVYEAVVRLNDGSIVYVHWLEKHPNYYHKGRAPAYMIYKKES